MSLNRFTASTPRLLASTRRVAAVSSHFSSSRLSARTMASVPKTMKGVIIENTGGTEVLQYKTDIPVPEPKEGQVLIKNDFVGINYIDTYVLEAEPAAALDLLLETDE